MRIFQGESVPDRIQIVFQDFWDVPRSFYMGFRQDLFYFECSFDHERDDYSDKYEVFELVATSPKDTIAPSTADYLVHRKIPIGQILISSVIFDETRRKTVDLETAITAYNLKNIRLDQA